MKLRVVSLFKMAHNSKPDRSPTFWEDFRGATVIRHTHKKNSLMHTRQGVFLSERGRGLPGKIHVAFKPVASAPDIRLNVFFDLQHIAAHRPGLFLSIGNYPVISAVFTGGHGVVSNFYAAQVAGIGGHGLAISQHLDFCIWWQGSGYHRHRNRFGCSRTGD